MKSKAAFKELVIYEYNNNEMGWIGINLIVYMIIGNWVWLECNKSYNFVKSDYLNGVFKGSIQSELNC